MTALVVRTRDDEQARSLARRVAELSPFIECAACRRRDFALLETPVDGLRTILRRETIDGRFPQQGVTQPLVTLVCTHCGHLEQFAEAILAGAAPDEYGDAVDGV